jgi:hypothetical protein
VNAALKELLEATEAWIAWMDSPGDGTDRTLEDEEAMLQAMRDAIATARKEGVPGERSSPAQCDLRLALDAVDRAKRHHTFQSFIPEITDEMADVILACLKEKIEEGAR